MALLLLKQEVSGSELVLGTGYSDLFVVFTRLVQLNKILKVLLRNSQRPFHSLVSDSACSELLLVTLNNQKII